MRLTFTLSAATSKDCAQQMDLPNVLIVLLNRFVHLHEQTNVDSADSAVSKTVLCSFLQGLKQIKTMIFSFLFYKL